MKSGNVQRSLSEVAAMPRPVTIGHTPDMDDAFMFYAMASRKIPLDGWHIEHVITDIQSLNQQALKAALDVTAISAAMYPSIEKDYWILSVGSSVGQNYGPVVVAARAYDVADLAGVRIAVPGLQTTACLLLSLAVKGFVPVVMSFENIPQAIAAGEVECGLVIHERQLTYRDEGLLPIIDLGVWWHQRVGLPIPLGLNAVKRSLGKPAAEQLATLLKRSIVYAMTHQEEAMAASMKFGRGIDATRARQFVGLYVNEETLSLSAASCDALKLLYQRGLEAGLIPSAPPLAFIHPAAG